MARSNNLEKQIVVDTDVCVNLLAEEVETATGKPLWVGPRELLLLVENRKVRGMLCITSLLEIRYLLRRKKQFSEEKIRWGIEKISNLLEVTIPDEFCLLRANSLQIEHPLDPFDAILLAFCLSHPPTVLVSRDTPFLKIASRYVRAFTPEEYLSQFAPFG